METQTLLVSFGYGQLAPMNLDLSGKGALLLDVNWGGASSLSFTYGSGTRFNDSIAVAVYGKPGTNRLNLTTTGGASCRKIALGLSRPSSRIAENPGSRSRQVW